MGATKTKRHHHLREDLLPQGVLPWLWVEVSRRLGRFLPNTEISSLDVPILLRMVNSISSGEEDLHLLFVSSHNNSNPFVLPLHHHR